MAKLVKLTRENIIAAIGLYRVLLALYRAGHRLEIVTAQGERIDPLGGVP